MGHSIDDLRTLTKIMVDLQPWTVDPNVVPLPWRKDIEADVRERIQSKKLVFGVIRSDGLVNPHPPIARAIDETVAALQAAGHKVRFSSSMSLEL